MKNEYLHSKWNSTIIDYTNCIVDGISFDSSEGKPVAEDVAHLLAKALETFILESKIKDTWTEMQWYSTSHGVFVKVNSKTQNHAYSIGIYKNEIDINTTILEPQNIKNLPDEFWFHFSELTNIGNFKFQDNAGLPDISKTTFDLKGCRSNVYKMIRNFVLLEEHSSSNTIDLGWFEFKWDISESLDSLLLSGPGVLKRMHRLNYLLYRCQYLKNSSKKRTSNHENAKA